MPLDTNSILALMVAFGSLSALLRTRRRQERELRTTFRWAVVTILTLIVGSWFFLKFVGYVAFLPWAVGILIPNIFLNHVIRNYECSDLAAGVRWLKWSLALPGTGGWPKMWSALYHADSLISNQNLGAALRELRVLQGADSLVRFYAYPKILFITEQWYDVLHATAQRTSLEHSHKPSVFFSRLRLEAFLQLGRFGEAQDFFDYISRCFDANSKEQKLLLRTLLQGLPSEFAARYMKQYEEVASEGKGEGLPKASYGIVAVVLLGYLFDSISTDDSFFEFAALAPGRVLVLGEWWRVLSCALLHGGMLHLIANILGVVVLGPHLERQIGAVRTVILFLLSTAGSSTFVVALTYLHVIEPSLLIGASGGVMGFIGAYLAVAMISFFATGAMYQKMQMKRVLAIILFQSIFDILTPQVSFSAHLGGVMSGFLFAFVLLGKQLATVKSESCALRTK
ncbi:MAG: rhomboid family intramembrane serine protease [Bdellovibrionales bacterium]|nr:rhomboid family intramembrane serine protease [Bdellovibrionales bacterium]